MGILAKLIGFFVVNLFPWFIVVAATLGGYLGGVRGADSLSVEHLGSLSTFFAADSTVLVGILVALALGAVIGDRTSPLAPVVFVIVIILLVALAASLVGLVPGLTGGLDRQLFAITIAGSVASAAGVAIVAYSALRATRAQRDGAWKSRLEKAGLI
jgi:hypothetical protein